MAGPKCTGVLCYALEPVTKNIYFLLGEETYCGTWSDFAGGPKKDESILEATIREFGEESMDLVMPRDQLRRELENNKYVCRLHYDSRVLYLKTIPFDASLPARFQTLRDQYLRNRTIPTDMLEKSRIEWFSLNRIRKMLRTEKTGSSNGSCPWRLRRSFVPTMQMILDVVAFFNVP